MVDAHGSPSFVYDGIGGPVFTPPGPAGINAPTPWIQATQQTYVSAVVGNVATSEPNSDDDHGRLLVRAATCTWKGKADDDLRPMIPIKNEALAAWLMGAIVLPSPLGFLACTHPWATRVAMLDYLETYLEGRLIAVVPLYVRMPPRIAETTLLLQLLERREGVLTDDSLVRELIKNAKRTSYDSLTRRLTFVLPDQAAAASWHSKMIMYQSARLQLLCLAILERKDVPSNATHPTAPNHDSLNYQVRILVQGVTESTVHAVLASSVPCTVTSVARGCPTANECTTQFLCGYF